MAQKLQPYWRLLGFYGITIITLLGYPIIAWLAIKHPEINTDALEYLYTVNIGSWLACAGIRQWEKVSEIKKTPSRGTK